MCILAGIERVVLLAGLDEYELASRIVAAVEALGATRIRVYSPDTLDDLEDRLEELLETMPRVERVRVELGETAARMAADAKSLEGVEVFIDTGDTYGIGAFAALLSGARAFATIMFSRVLGEVLEDFFTVDWWGSPEAIYPELPRLLLAAHPMGQGAGRVLKPPEELERLGSLMTVNSYVFAVRGSQRLINSVAREWVEVRLVKDGEEYGLLRVEGLWFNPERVRVRLLEGREGLVRVHEVLGGGGRGGGDEVVSALLRLTGFTRFRIVGLEGCEGEGYEPVRSVKPGDPLPALMESIVLHDESFKPDIVVDESVAVGLHNAVYEARWRAALRGGDRWRDEEMFWVEAPSCVYRRLQELRGRAMLSRDRLAALTYGAAYSLLREFQSLRHDADDCLVAPLALVDEEDADVILVTGDRDRFEEWASAGACTVLVEPVEGDIVEARGDKLPEALAASAVAPQLVALLASAARGTGVRLLVEGDAGRAVVEDLRVKLVS